jgi:hypothetical protein
LYCMFNEFFLQLNYLLVVGKPLNGGF